MRSRREQIVALIAVLLVAALLLDQLALSPLLARLSEADAAVARHEQALNQAVSLFDNSLRARRRWKELAGGTMKQAASDAESQVLHAVRQWAQASGLTLTSLKPERTERDEAFQRITFRATASGTMSQVAGFLVLVQTSNIPVRVRDLQINARREGTDDLSLTLGLATITESIDPARHVEPARGSAPSAEEP